MTLEITAAPQKIARPWIRRSSKVQPELWFDSVEETFRTVGVELQLLAPTVVMPEDASDLTALSIQWSNLRAAYSVLDFEALTWRQSLLIERDLRKRLPRLLEDYMSSLLKHGLNATASSTRLQKSRRRLRTSAMAIVARQHQPKHHAGGNAAQVSFNANLQVAPLRTSFALVSKLSAFEPSLGEAAGELLRDWKRARSWAIGAEECYRLEQMMAELLPKIVNVLPEVGEAQRTEATGLIGEQLELLHAQVRAMLAQHEMDAMGVLRAQGAFIRELAAQPSARLVLDK